MTLKMRIFHTRSDLCFIENGGGSKAQRTPRMSKERVGVGLMMLQTVFSLHCSLTVAVDTLDLRELTAGAAHLLVVGNTLIQAEQLPVVTTGLVAGHRLHQVRAVSRPSRWLVGDLSLPQFETCSTAKSIKSHLSCSTFVCSKQDVDYRCAGMLLIASYILRTCQSHGKLLFYRLHFN